MEDIVDVKTTNMEDITSPNTTVTITAESLNVTTTPVDVIHNMSQPNSAPVIISINGDTSQTEVSETEMTHVTHDMSQVDIISQADLTQVNRDVPQGHVMCPDNMVPMSSDVSHTEVISEPDSNKLEMGSEEEAILMKTSQGNGEDELQQVDMMTGTMPDGCLVCGDKGSGYHYSVFSCEGCKGFFKRTVQKNLEYVCKEGQHCIINKFTRNSCQFCRFNKCMDMGMKREAVREDRTPGGKHRHKRPRVDDLSSDGMVKFNTILVTGQGDEQMTQKLVEAHPDLIPNIEGDMLQEATKLGVNELMQYGYMELRLIIEWARKVPGFSDLLIEDQMSLLKASFMELNVFRLAYRSLDCDDSIHYADGVVVNGGNTSESEWVKELFNCNLAFVKRLKEIAMDMTEFSILNAVILTYPDAVGVRNKLAITNLQCRILDCLHKYTCKAYPNEPKRHARMLLRLPTLRMVSAKAAECFLSMSLDGSVKMNALVLEMMS